MISLKRIIESQGAEGQYYDLGVDFSNFKRAVDGTTDQIKQKFETTIGAKLNGKRIRARSSRGYKQYVKDYEFDVAKITLDDYYDNYVVVAHDNSTPKAKEYFLKAGFKITIIGPASGQPSKGLEGQTENPYEKKGTMLHNPDKAQSQPMAPTMTNHKSIENPLQEDEDEEKKQYDAYSVNDIMHDIDWLPQILVKPKTSLRDFTKGLGWMTKNNGKKVALFDLKFPKNAMKIDINTNTISDILNKINTDPKEKFELVKITPNEEKDEFTIRLKKTMME